MPAAFFDMDKTLIAVNSARLWVEHLWREGELSKRDLARSVASLLGYKLAVVDMEKIARDAVARLTGESEDDMRTRVEDWYHDTVKSTIRPRMVEVLENHRSDGHHLVLLTASSPYVATPLAAELDLDHVISTRFEVRDGRFTGNLVEPMCYGPGKVQLSENWADEHEISLEESWFYTDSYTDLPMLERVGNPVVVAPDPRLRRWAQRNGIRELDVG